MGLLIIKPGVSLKGMRPETVTGIMIVKSVFDAHGLDTILTSVTEGKHGKGSKHPSGNAFDCRSKHVPTTAEKHQILAEIKQALGGTGVASEFDVLLESLGKAYEHYHIEHDPPSWSVTEA